MIETIGLLGFLTLGLLGGFGHCIGMCSPFVLFVSRRYVPPDAARGTNPAESRRAALIAQLWYTVGRILTYVALGALAGALGGVVELAGALLGLQRAASVVAGAALVLWALLALADLVPALAGSGKLFGRVAGAMKGRVPGHPFATGLFLGLLPCGLLYSAVLAAVARGGALQGALALALFGLGTAPALLGISLADELLARHRTILNRLSQVFILAMGAWFLWSGLAG
ncbi:MAG: sulfite exporter TauE/SafE family protein [Holophagales bacterium]|nr:sulfite exporter TauE/SafE family protein [Holophagales bacterium]